MKIAYNCDKSSLAEPSLKRNIVPDAQRTENFTSLPWRAQPDSLWGHLPYSSVLQKTEIEMVFAKTGLFSSTFQLLSSRRIDLGHLVCFDCWHPPFKQDKDSSRQRCFSADHRSHEVPLCQQFEALPQTSQSPNYPEHQPGSRSLKVKDVLSPQTTDQPSVRFRLFRSHPLWQVDRGSRSRLQPSQKRGSFLPSFALFRISLQRLLAWSLEAWERLYLFRRSRVLEGMSWENSIGHLPYPNTSRFGFLRSQIYRTSGSRGHWLCHRSQDDPSNQKQNRKSSLSQLQEGLGCRRIFLPTFPVEEAPSFCRHPSSPSRKRLRTTDPLYPEALCLPGLCNKSFSKSRKDLVFLSAQGRYRGHHQGAERKLCLGQDSNQQFSSQPVLFPSFGVCLQSCQLVQETLPATEIPACHLRDDSSRILGIASQIGQNRPPEYTQITCRVYRQTNLGPHYPEYQKNEAIINFNHFAKLFSNEHPEYPVF